MTKFEIVTVSISSFAALISLVAFWYTICKNKFSISAELRQFSFGKNKTTIILDIYNDSPSAFSIKSVNVVFNDKKYLAQEFVVAKDIFDKNHYETAKHLHVQPFLSNEFVLTFYFTLKNIDFPDKLKFIVDTTRGIKKIDVSTLPLKYS